MSATKIEFAVQMKCDSCVKAVESSLQNTVGIKDVQIDLPTNTVLVDTSLSTESVRKLIESTGRKAVVKGIGGHQAAVSIIEASGNNEIQGVVRFTQLDKNTCIVDGTVDGLNVSKYLIAIHECGDLSEGCKSVGDCYNPTTFKPDNGLRQNYGEIGTIVADKNGRSTFRFEDSVIKLSEVTGRSLVISEADHKVACGIIARSSGLFQNPKTICACDGTTLWDEKEAVKVKANM